MDMVLLKHNNTIPRRKSMINMVPTSNKGLFTDVRAPPFLLFDSDHGVVLGKLWVLMPKVLRTTMRMRVKVEILSKDQVKAKPMETILRMPQRNVKNRRISTKNGWL